MNDKEIGKREIEREHFGLFLDAYKRTTGETFPEMYDSETPDFIGRDDKGSVVGIEIVQLRFAPDERFMRQIFAPEPHDPDAWWQLLEVMHKKDQLLKKGHWSKCERKILVVVLIDTSIEAVAAGSDTGAAGLRRGDRGFGTPQGPAAGGRGRQKPALAEAGGDAGFTYETVVDAIREAGGDYFLFVKSLPPARSGGNQPELKAEIAHAFGDDSPLKGCR